MGLLGPVGLVGLLSPPGDVGIGLVCDILAQLPRPSQMSKTFNTPPR